MDERGSTRDNRAPSPDATPGDSALPSGLATLIAQCEVLLRQGRPRDAELLLHSRLAPGRRHPAAVTLLARTMLAQGRSRDGLAIVEQHRTETAAPEPSILLLRAQILLASGQVSEAVAAFRETIAVAPNLGIAHLGLAAALGQDGQSEAANASAMNAIAKGFDNAGSRAVLARSFFEMRRYEEAEAEFRRALKLDPGNAATHSSLAELVWMRTGDVRAALADIEQSVGRLGATRALDLHVTKARLLCAAGRPAEAMDELERLVAAHPRHLPLRMMAVKAAIGIDAARAFGHAEHAVRMAPANGAAVELYGDALLASGRPDAAAQVAQRLLAANPRDNHAIALLTASWRLLGDARYWPFHDYASLVQACMLDVPEGWPDLDHYLADLAADLHREHGLLAEPVEQSVRHGSQIEHRPPHSALPAIRALPQAIHGPIQRYMDRLRHGVSDWHRQVTGLYRLSGLWSVRLHSEGHHVSHFHGKGWISSACYVQMPSAVDASGGQGWLKFGEPGLPTRPSLQADYFVRPAPGMLVLFPSWMWHGTSPFTSPKNEHRLTVAFDVVPVPVA